MMLAQFGPEGVAHGEAACDSLRDEACAPPFEPWGTGLVESMLGAGVLSVAKSNASNARPARCGLACRVARQRGAAENGSPLSRLIELGGPSVARKDVLGAAPRIFCVDSLCVAQIFFGIFGFEVCVHATVEGSVAGWSSLVARWAHNPKVVGSNPAPATKKYTQGPPSEGLVLSACHDGFAAALPRGNPGHRCCHAAYNPGLFSRGGVSIAVQDSL
jgi:hypothetical protein